MKKIVNRNIFIIASAAVVFMGASIAFLAWDGWFFPVHYVKTGFGGKYEEGYRVRSLRNGWSLEGKWTLCWKDGTKNEEGYYHNNRKVGKWTLWDVDDLIKEVQEYDDEGWIAQSTIYEKGVIKKVTKPIYDKKNLLGRYITEKGVTKYIKYVPNSGTIWDTEDWTRSDVIEEDYQNKVREGATEEEAREFVRKKYDLED
jgi:hypothetical protein